MFAARLLLGEFVTGYEVSGWYAWARQRARPSKSATSSTRRSKELLTATALGTSKLARDAAPNMLILAASAANRSGPMAKQLKAAILARRAAKAPRKKRTQPKPRQYTIADWERETG